MLTVSFATNRTIQISFHLKKSYKFFSVIVAGLLQLEERTTILGGSNVLLSLSLSLSLSRNLHQKKIEGLAVEFEPEQKIINSFNYHVDVP